MQNPLDVPQWLQALRLPALTADVLGLRALTLHEQAGPSECADQVAKDLATAARLLARAGVSVGSHSDMRELLRGHARRLGKQAFVEQAFLCQFQSALAHVEDSPALRTHGFWRHALLTARTARELASTQPQDLNGACPEDFLLAGLLHDVGQLVLLDHAGAEYVALCANCPTTRELLEQEEARFDGLNHADVGGLLATSWELPHPIPEWIRFHHEPDLAQQHAGAAALLALAGDIVEAVAARPDELASVLEQDLRRSSLPGTRFGVVEIEGARRRWRRSGGYWSPSLVVPTLADRLVAAPDRDS